MRALSEILDQIGQVRHGLMMAVGRGVLRLVADAAEDHQRLQVDLLADETADGVERFQDYGVSSRPRTGAEAIYLSIGGRRANGVVICVADRRYRLAGLAEGEVALHDDQDQVVHLKRDGVVIETPFKVSVTAADEVKVTAPKAVLDCAQVELGGEGGKAIARHDDPIVAGKIVATSTQVKSL